MRTKNLAKIQIIAYPETIEILTAAKLPPFKYGCEVRTGIAREAIARTKHSAPHAPEDFIVERVEITESGEKWHLGS